MQYVILNASVRFSVRFWLTSICFIQLQLNGDLVIIYADVLFCLS